MEYIIGIIVSLFVQLTKNKMGTSITGTIFATLLFSFVGAAAYVLLSQSSLWPTITQVIIVAGAFYAFIIRRFE